MPYFPLTDCFQELVSAFYLLLTFTDVTSFTLFDIFDALLKTPLVPNLRSKIFLNLGNGATRYLAPG